MGSVTNFPYGVSSFGMPMNGLGLYGPSSKTFFCDPLNGSDSYDGLSPATAVKTLAAGYALLTANRHDTLVLIGLGTFTNLAASLVWEKDFTHLMGMTSPTWMNQRAPIGHSANFTPGISITAKGCSFRNVYFSYGRGNAGNLVGVQVSGGRNYFENFHFGGPGHATEAGTAGFKLLNLSGATECTFRRCTIGFSTEARSAANTLLAFDSGAGRCLFEDCNFISMCSATTPYFINNTAVDGIVDFVLMRRCSFVNFSANWATKLAGAVKNADGNSGAIILDGCSFAGVTAVGAAGNTARTLISGYDSTNASALGLAVAP